MHSPLKIHVACCSTSDKQGTMQMLEKMVDGFAFGKIHNWTGAEVDRRRVAAFASPARGLWRTLTVLANGEVALCCLDYDGQHLLGRIDAGTSLADVWLSPAYREVRRLHRLSRQAEIPLCRNCSKSYL